MIDLHIYFAGLMTFARKGGEMRALLVDARTPGRVKGTERVPVHDPVVQFSVADAVAKPLSYRPFDDAFGEKKALWTLNKDYLELAPPTQSETALLHRDDPIVDRRIPISRADASGLGWLATLHGENGSHAVLKQGLLDPIGSPFNSTPIAASVRLDQGSLSSAGFTAELGNFVIWETRGRLRALTSVVECRVEVDAPEVHLAATKFDGSPGDVLTLKPAPDSQGRLEVWILNMERDIIELQRPPTPARPGTPSPEYLFFHDLLENPPVLDDTPIGRSRERGRGEVAPAVSACEDPGMRRLYFSSTEGETAFQAPCSPNYRP